MCAFARCSVPLSVGADGRKSTTWTRVEPLEYGGHRLSIVCTGDRTEPVVAVAEPRAIDGTAVEAGPLTFVEVPELVAVLAEFPAFRVPTPADLAGPFDERTWPGHHPADLKYWAPTRFGRGALQLLGLTGVRARRHERAFGTRTGHGRCGGQASSCW